MDATTLVLHLVQVESNKLVVTSSEALGIHSSPTLHNTGMNTGTATYFKIEKI